jgi:tripartite-type tricarboxylate transporter receptor subunit TctC
MKLFRSLALATMAAALATSSATLSPVLADDTYPNGTVTFLVPYAAGANGDIVSRILADDLQKKLGQPVVIDNRPGAGGNIGAQRGKDEKPDGYTIMLGTNTHTINQNLYPDAGFDLLTDFEPVSQITATYQLLLVNPEVPVKTVPEFIEYAKTHDLNYSSGGNGSSGHLFTELFDLKTGIKMTHIPYDGVASGLVDLIAGRVEATFSSISSTLEMVRTGELRAIAIAAPERSPLLPEVPTLKESGVEGMESGTWQGILVPAKTPKDIVDKLNKAIRESLAAPEVTKKLDQQGVIPSPSTPEEFRTLIAEDLKRWHDVITAASIKLD